MMQLGTFRASYRFFTWSEMWPTNLFIVIMLVVEWIHKDGEHGLSIAKYKKMVRWIMYCIVVLLIVFEGAPSAPFVYFQF